MTIFSLLCILFGSSIVLFAMHGYETRPNRRFRAEQFATAVWTSVCGLAHAARIVLRGAK